MPDRWVIDADHPQGHLVAMTDAEAAAFAAFQTTATASFGQRATADGNAVTLQAKAQQALTTNSTYLALASPTAAQTTAQVKAITRQVNALIRLSIQSLDTISDT